MDIKEKIKASDIPLHLIVYLFNYVMQSNLYIKDSP